MFSRSKPARILALTGSCALASGLFAGPIVAQQKSAPMFYDARRLPDLEVERRNQDVLLEQRRVAEEQRVQADIAAKRKLEEARVTAQFDRKSADEKRAEEARVSAETARKADDEKRAITEAAAKKKADDQRSADAEAQRKLNEETRSLALAEAKKKAEDVRLANLAADAQRKTEDEKRAAAEVSEKKRADEQQVAAVEAQRKLDEETRNAALADAKKKAEEVRVAAAAEAARKSEDARVAAASDARRKADEARVAAEAARKSEEEKQVAAAAASAAAAQRPAKTAALIAPPIINPNNPATPGVCDAKLTTLPLVGGRMQLLIDSACRKGQLITFKYGDYTYGRKLDSAGHATLVIDLFLGNAEPVDLTYADGKTDKALPVANDLAQVSKVALIWQSPVDLDLHAFENGAAFGKPGHVWPQAAGSAEAAKALMTERGRGAGFLSSIGSGQTDGSKMTVYTWFHSPEQDTGAVSMAVDYASRGSKASGEMCGQGTLAEVPFETVLLDSKGVIQNESGLISSVKCGETLSANARYLKGIVPDLRFKR